MSIPRDLRGIAQSLQSQGWRVEPTKKGHVRFVPPNNGPIVFASGTPSDGARARKNLLADLRRSCPFEENP